MPKRRTNADGGERRCGVEIEFANVTLERAAQVVQKLFGGTIKEHHTFKIDVERTRLGDFSVESDSSLLNQRKWQKYIDLGRPFENLLSDFTRDFLPNEIATPPIKISELAAADELREALRQEGALGTHAHFFTAFGMQFNPEMPDLRLETLLSYMRAFFELYPSLQASEDIPLARKVLPFIDPFPKEYIDLVLDRRYKPTLNGLMRDYLEQNPTRNRPLDWLPLFAFINKDLVFEYPVERDLVKPRPTLHYRLPSSLVDDPSWSIADEWNKWCAVEDRADEIAREFQAAGAHA